jgi:ribosomal protein S18 acetylase RimI-like enzyme
MIAAKVRTMTPDEEAAIDTIVLAFATDPAARWTWPGQRQFLGALPRLARAFGGKAFTSGAAYCTEDYSGVALWLPPGIEPDENDLKEVMQSTVAPSQLDDVFALFGEMAKYHPHEPHWYLPLIGVDPLLQGKGHGHALMAYALERCDRDRLPAYLESSNPRNIPFYRRHGFLPLGTIQAGSSPPIVPMLRAAID